MAEVIAGARTYVDVPAPAVWKGGVLDVATVVDDPDVHALMGAMYLTDACATAEEWTEWCTLNPTATKEFDLGPDVVVGDPFIVYAGVECDFQKPAEAEARARNRFNYAERRMVDKAVATWLNDNAVEVAHGVGPYTIAASVGMLELHASLNYGGVPTILMGVDRVPCACSSHVVYPSAFDGSLATCQGSKVAGLAADLDSIAGTGTDPGSSWIYVTGQITLLRSALSVISVPPMGGADAAPPRALAERIYVPLIECVAGKTDATCE